MIPAESLIVVLLGVLVTILVGALAIAAFSRRNLARGAGLLGLGEEERLEMGIPVAEVPPQPALGLPSEPLERHRLLIAIENRGRQEALRLALKWGVCGVRAPGMPRPSAAGPRRWLLAGPGPLGAATMALARHLDAFSVPLVVQSLQAPEKLGPWAQGQWRILNAARFNLVPTPSPQSLEGVTTVVVGVEEELLLGPRRQDLERILEAAVAGGCPLERLEPFDPSFVPSAPQAGEPEIPVPELVLSREEVRLLDSLAQEQYGVPSAALMENAGYWAARQAYWAAASLARMKDGSPPRVVVVCGRGNNGGDGMVMARYLGQWGISVQVALLGEKDRVSEDQGRNLKLLESLGFQVRAILDPLQFGELEVWLSQAHLVVDAVLGTGMSGPVRGLATGAIRRMNEARGRGAWILAVDCPSGLDCNTGQPLGCCVCADLTVSFAAHKQGFALGQGPELCGKVVLADIGLPRELYRRRA